MSSLIEIHWTKRLGEWLENSQLFFLSNVAFEIQRAFLARRHGWNLNFPLNDNLALKNQNEPMMTFIHLFSHVLWATEGEQFLYFLPSKRPFAWKPENTLKPGPDSSLVFNNLKTSQPLRSKLIRTTIPISKDDHQNWLPVSFSSFHLIYIILVHKQPQNKVSNL